MLIKKADILLTTYTIEENLFVHVEWSPVKHAASQVSVRKKSSKKKEKEKRKRVTTGWTNISGPGLASFLFGSSMY